MKYSLLLLLLTTGCATMVGGLHEQVTVTTPVAGKDCILNNDKGTWYLKDTPNQVMVRKSFSKLVVNCEDKRLSVKSKMNLYEVLNSFWFVIGDGIDMASGAGYDYPTLLEVK